METTVTGPELLKALTRAGLTILFYMAAMVALRICAGAR